MFYMSEDMQRDLHAVGSCKLKGFRFSYLFSAEITKPRPSSDSCLSSPNHI